MFRYVDFEGTSTGKEFWFFRFYSVLFAAGAILLDNICHLNLENKLFGPLFLIFGFVSIFPATAVAVRRLHDTGKSGWFILIGLIPILGSIWLLVQYLKPSAPDKNEFETNLEKHAANEQSFDLIQSILLAVIIWFIFTYLYWYLIFELDHDYSHNFFYKPLSRTLDIIWRLIPFALCVGIKNKSKRILGIVLSILYFIIAFFPIEVIRFDF